MQPYDYRGINNYYNNNNNDTNYNNQNNVNKPINNPFSYNSNTEITNNNIQGNENIYAQNYYHPQQLQQGIYVQNQTNIQSNNLNENIYGDGTNQNAYLNQQQYRGVANQFIPNVNNNNLKQPANVLGFDNTNNVNNAQPIINESYQELLQFNAFSHFIKSSVSYMPANTTLKQKSYVPLGFVIQPLAPIPDGYPELSSVNFGNSTVVRCKKCRTYINPFVRFESGGKKWNCNMCYHINDTPQFYFVPLDEKGKRKDLFQRPELCTGSVEFIAPSDYMIRPPQPPVYLFLIDVTVTSVNSGLLDVICNTIKKLLPKNNDINNKKSFDSRTLIGIITFDSTIHFYNLNSNLKQTQMMIVPDIQDIFIPLPEDILVNAHECQNIIDNLLDNLPNMWRNNKITDCCAGNALKAAFMVLKKIGGKLLFFLSSVPNIGDLTVNLNRETKEKSKYKNIYSSNSSGNNIVDAKLREVELLTPYNNLYAELAQNITQYQIAVDLFACPLYNLDLATIYPLIKNSGGSLYYYPQFNVHQYNEKLREELLFALTTETAWESVMRIRISRGWKITNWYGNFQFRGVDLLALPNCHSSQSFSIIVDLEENVVQDSVVYVQSALLYTNSNGERRIRLHTYALPVTQNIKTITDSINPQVVVSLLSHQAIDISKKGKIADGRNLIQTLCSQVLSSQLLPSESAKLLSIYILGMLKSVSFRDSGDVPSDLRIYHWSRIENIPVESREAYFYPRMFSLHNLEKHHGNYDENNSIMLPDTLNLTCENMTQDGCYIIEDGETIIMWIGRGINPQWVYAVFGVQSLDQLNSDYAENHIGSTGNPYGIQILNIVNALRKIRTPPYMRLIVVKQGDPLEYKFFSSLVEDRSQHMMMSLKEFLAKICPKFPQFAPALNNPHTTTHGR
ncbi:protein transport protein Sec24A, putative [Plasmodium relictum]|uniref:Protein transport protein Sec24A, putative n=2 Tax=Plasmodium relictum TaxID=85471 RepID=A0A1J1H864_PLARL|nr:protein transport protein Sec24A, putative [Plasmodium relictum]CRH00749.1 protein transport protein Sec24A, putative [Plasmodium relictum]